MHTDTMHNPFKDFAGITMPIPDSSSTYESEHPVFFFSAHVSYSLTFFFFFSFCKYIEFPVSHYKEELHFQSCALLFYSYSSVFVCSVFPRQSCRSRVHCNLHFAVIIIYSFAAVQFPPTGIIKVPS